MKTQTEIRENEQRKEFWGIIKTQKPRLHRALKLAGNSETRLLAICASALISIAMRENKSLKQKRKPSAYNIFFGEQMKLGKTMKECAEMWRIKDAEKQLLTNRELTEEWKTKS